MASLKSIEVFFLNTLLRICLAGVSLVLLADVIIYPQDTLSISIDVVILVACAVAYGIRKHFATAAVLIVTIIVLVAMIYQCLMVPVNTTTSLSIVLVVGFIYSVMLQGRLMHSMHALTIIALHTIFVIQYLNPELRLSPKLNDVVTVAITYTILYFILTFTTARLKRGYDKIHASIKEVNHQLQEKAAKVVQQNEELLQIQDKLNAINRDLEKIVNDRTTRIQEQNEILYKYSYTNAHHLRGPVARLLGLANIYKLEPRMEPDDIIQKMTQQAKEIDAVIQQINIDLEANNSIKTSTVANTSSDTRNLSNHQPKINNL